MSFARTIQSPGVEIRERDLSLRVDAPVGTSVLAMGFTSQGPTDEVIQVTTLQEYETLFGRPTNSAERYAYHTVRPLLTQSSANVFFSRLPYGKDDGDVFTQDKYSALVYPTFPEVDGLKVEKLFELLEVADESAALSAIQAIPALSAVDLDTEIDALSTLGLVYENSVTLSNYMDDKGLNSFTWEDIQSNGFPAQFATDYYVGRPYHVEVNRFEYEQIISNQVEWGTKVGQSIDFSGNLLEELGKGALIVLNTAKTTINETYEGYYLGITDNRMTNPASDFTDIVEVLSINDRVNGDSFIPVPEGRIDFILSADNPNTESISLIMEELPAFSIDNQENHDILAIGLFKLRRTPFTSSEVALDFALSEAFIGSFDADRQIQSSTGGSNESLFLETVDEVSNNVKFLVHSALQDLFTLDVTSAQPIPEKKARTLKRGDTLSYGTSTQITNNSVDALFPLGVYSPSRGQVKAIGSVPSKVSRVLDLVENVELFDLDIVVEGGLGTIFTSIHEKEVDEYDETKTWNSLQGLKEQTSGPLAEGGSFTSYNTIATKLDIFCRQRRKDCMAILDPIRQTLVVGDDTRVLDTVDSDGNPAVFGRDIFWPLRNTFRALNTSYAATYGNWVKVFDNFVNMQKWVPFSGFAAAQYSNIPNVWDAPAGLTRGILSGINDIAIYPNQKERDQLYRISVNPVTFFPADGFVTWGQKTLLSKPSAFDRVNVRRTFLFLEKATLNTARFFVFENNTLFTRTQIVNVLDPLFREIKDAEGIRDYRLVCDERNNTDQIIERNELKIDVYIKPVKAGEFILVDFFATRQDADFDEII